MTGLAETGYKDPVTPNSRVLLQADFSELYVVKIKTGSGGAARFVVQVIMAVTVYPATQLPRRLAPAAA